MAWFHLPSVLLVVCGSGAIVATGHGVGQRGLTSLYLLVPFLLLPVIAALLHGQTWIQRVVFTCPYALLTLGVYFLGVFALQSISHPVAGLIMGLPTLLVSLFLLWLLSTVINKRGW